MLRKKKGQVEWLEFEQLADHFELLHGVFLRHGGVSEGPYSALNMSNDVKDVPDCVEKNREILKKALFIEELIFGKQKHSAHLSCVPGPLGEECDGLLTKQKGKGLVITHADCQAAIFYDPICKAIANVHCGWRGNVQNIYAQTIDKMKTEMSSHPKNILVCVSPSLGPEFSEFIHYRSEFPEHFWSFQVKPNYFDLWSIARMQLEEAGILPHHIEIAKICTYKGEKDFFSYRREKISGRHATIVSLK